MIVKNLIQSMMLKLAFSSRPVIDVPADAGDDAVVVVARTVKKLRIDTRTGLAIVGLIGGLGLCRIGGIIVRFTAVGLASGMIGVGVDMLTEVNIGVVVAAAIASEVFATASCIGDVRAGVCAGTVIGIDVAFVTRANLAVGVLTDLLTDTTIGFVSSVRVDVLAGVDTNMVAAAMTDPEFIDTWVTLEYSFRFC